MDRRLKILFWVALGIGRTVVAAAGQGKHSPTHASQAMADPRIIAVQGKAQLKELGIKAPHPLTAKDRDLALLPGDEVLCEKGTVTLMIHRRRVTRTPAQGWYSIPTSRTHDRLAADLTSFFNIAGRARGDVNIYSPPYEGGAVWPEKLVFRWEPTTQKRWADATLTANGKRIWSEKKIDIAPGKLDSSDARTALSTVRDADPEAEVTLHLHIPESSEGPDLVYSATFTMLSKENERGLQETLHKSDLADNTIVRCILRANSFSQVRLYSEAAEEYVRALALCPTRHDIRRAAYQALLRTGNVAAAKQIQIPERRP